MKIGDRFFLKGAFDRESLAFLRQMGGQGAVVNIAGELRDNQQGTPVVSEALSERLRSGLHWEAKDLIELRKAVTDFELDLCSLAHTPPHRFQKILLGLPGRDEEIESWCRSLKAMGEAGIPILQYSWHTNVGSNHINWHTFTGHRIRGGALAEGFDYEQAKDIPPTDIGVVTQERMWEALEYFLKAVIPVAEKVGVRMSLHPADPQVPALAGVARIVRSVSAFERMLDLVPSPANAMTFCQGCFAQMLDAEGVYKAIAKFAQRGAIALVHFRNVTPDSTAERFTEAFWDEGKVNMHRAILAYTKAGFDGYLTPDHHPHTIGDSVWGHRSRAFALGYMRGLVQSVASERKPC